LFGLFFCSERFCGDADSDVEKSVSYISDLGICGRKAEHLFAFYRSLEGSPQVKEQHLDDDNSVDTSPLIKSKDLDENTL
jgi:hypothetical protein